MPATTGEPVTPRSDTQAQGHDERGFSVCATDGSAERRFLDRPRRLVRAAFVPTSRAAKCRLGGASQLSAI
jgi:hypothetical protein